MKTFEDFIEDYYRGTGEKVVARTKKWMDKKGMPISMLLLNLKNSMVVGF